MKDCPHPMALSDEELLSCILDEDPLPEVAQEHLHECDICQQRFKTYKKTHTLLVSHLYRRQCPNSMQLSLYCSHLLPVTEQIHIANHLQACPLCTAEAADTWNFLREVEPLSTLYTLPALFTPGAPLPSLSDPMPYVIAIPIKQQERLVRRGDLPATWPRQYRVESIDLSLHLSRASKGEYVLLAIISSIDAAKSIDAYEGIVAELYPAPGPFGIYSDGGIGNKQAEPPLLRTQIDDVGDMVFDAVPAGTYILVAHLPEHAVVVEDVTIGPG